MEPHEDPEFVRDQREHPPPRPPPAVHRETPSPGALRERIEDESASLVHANAGALDELDEIVRRGGTIRPALYRPRHLEADGVLDVGPMAIGAGSPTDSTPPDYTCVTAHIKEQFRSDSGIMSLDMGGTGGSAERNFVVAGMPDVAMQRVFYCYPLGSTWNYRNHAAAVSIPLLRVVGYNSRFYTPPTSEYSERASWVVVRYGTSEAEGEDIEWSVGPGTVAIEVRHDQAGNLLNDSESAQILMPAITFQLTRTEDDWGFMDGAVRTVWNPYRWSWGEEAFGTPSRGYSQYRRSLNLTGCVNAEVFLGDSTHKWLYMGATVNRAPNPFHVTSGYYRYRATYHFARNPQRKSACATDAGWQVWHVGDGTAKDIYCRGWFADLQLTFPGGTSLT
jgi:hypothetical protein